MAKKRKTPKINSEPRKKAGRRRESGGGFFRFLWAIRYLILLAIIGALIFWQRFNLVNTFGWGLLFIAAAVITLIVQIKRRKFSSFFIRLNRWLGTAAFILAIWGILAIFELGGSFGQSIARHSAPEIENVLRILGLVVLGVILVAPGACFRLVPKFISWL
ncbi:MAG TPA: hypothetical protein VMW37_04740, partial [Dehalococcoidales bacterium]|nr:hypothetical protein [Dehalococcoidales bacterium]